MPVQKHDLWLGAALTQIVEHDSFKSLNRVEKPPKKPKQGHYTLNDDRRILMKYDAVGDNPWDFTFMPDDLRILAADACSGDVWFVVLVCGRTDVALLDSEQFYRVVGPLDSSQKSVSVSQKPGEQLVVSGPGGSLRVPETAFPRDVFTRVASCAAASEREEAVEAVPVRFETCDMTASSHQPLWGVVRIGASEALSRGEYSDLTGEPCDEEDRGLDLVFDSESNAAACAARLNALPG